MLFVNRFFHPDVSATSQMLTDVAVGLAGAGWRVDVICSRLRYDDARSRLPERERHEGVEVHRVASTAFGRGNLAGRALDYASFLASVRRSIAALADGNTIVVAKTDPPMLGAFAWRAAKSRGARFVQWIQDLFPEVAQQAGVPIPAAGTLRRMRNASLANADALVAVGERMAERLRPHGVPVHVIPNWADGAAIVPIPTAQSGMRRQSGLDGKFVVGYSGNFGRVHDFDTILEAARQLADDARVHFLFTGGGRQAGRVREASRHLRNVTMVAYQPKERLADSLAAADVHLCSLLPAFEGLVVPSKVYGIMAAARPCIHIGDPEGEVARLVRRGGFGFCIASGDSAGLASLLRTLARDGGGGALGRAGRDLFERDFDRPVALERWKAALESVN